MATDIRVEPVRFLKRVYRARMLRHCESLPECQISPLNRLLYVCRRCRFANPHGELCLFCGGRCTVSAPNSVSPVRRRRVSAPQLLNDIQKDRLHLAHRRIAILRIPCPSSDGCQSASQLAVESSRGSVSWEGTEPSRLRRRRYRDAAIYTVDQVQAENMSVRNERFMQTLVTQSRSASRLSASSSASGSQRVPSSGPTRTYEEIRRSSPSPPPGSYRTLRRRERMPLRKIISSCSLRATMIVHMPVRGDQTMMEVSGSASEYKANTMTGPMCSNISPRSHKPPAAGLSILPPLGHPTRPLYTAIRRNMFSSPSANACINYIPFPPIRPTSINDDGSTDPFDRVSRISGDWVSIPSFRPCTDGYGFSMSGQTELRMALARLNDSDGIYGVGDFKFQETKRPMTYTGRLKRIGRCFKDFFTIRT